MRKTGKAAQLIPSAIRRPLARFLRNAFLKRPQLSGTDRGYLASIYYDDIIRLQEMTGHNLSAWLNAPAASRPAIDPEQTPDTDEGLLNT